MCIGQPLQVERVEPGEHTRHAWCRARDGSLERVDTALVGRVQPGDWLLVFLGNAREALSPARAHEMRETLALLEQAVGLASPREVASSGDHECPTTAPFELPSALGLDALRALTGQSATATDGVDTGSHPLQPATTTSR